MNILRRATHADAVFLYELANDPETRSASVNQGLIPWADHLSWFHKVTNSPDHWVYILERNGMPAGTIRFQITDDGPSLSYAIAPGARGLGLSAVLLNLGIQTFAAETKHRTIVGLIAEENIRSQKAFAKAAFSETGQKSIEGRLYRKYELRLSERDALPGLSK